MTAGNRVAIVGLGYSNVGRNTGLSPNELMIQATMAAFDDSGLTVHDIDGITSVGTEPLNDAWMLGVEPLNWWASGMMVPRSGTRRCRRSQRSRRASATPRSRSG